MSLLTSGVKRLFQWSEVLSIVGQALEENDIKYCTVASGGKPFQVNLERFKVRAGGYFP